MYNVERLAEAVKVGEYPTEGEAIEEAKNQSKQGHICFVANEDYSYLLGIAFKGEFIRGE